MQVYGSIDGFYGARPERITSGEADYGVHWRDRNRDWPRWRVSYIQVTGEVYATCTGGQANGEVRVLGIVPADPVRPGEVYYRTLDRILDGWADPKVSGFRLSWVAERLAAWAEPAPDEAAFPLDQPAEAIGYEASALARRAAEEDW
jgi:hypothetical protein